MKIILIIVLVLIGSIVIYGLTDSDYYTKFAKTNCEKGYKLYQYGITDGSEIYYDMNHDYVGVCKSFLPGETCELAKKKIGKCEDKNIIIERFDSMKAISGVLRLPFLMVNPWCSRFYYGYYEEGRTFCPWW